MKRPSLLDPSFRYVPASRTNIAATFARVKRELKAAEAEKVKQPAANVKPLKKEQRRG